MDMSSMMSGMGGIGGMDMASAGLFTSVNKAIAQGVWYAIGAIVLVLFCFRLASIAQSRSRRKLAKRNPQSIPSRPRGLISQAAATATATVREMSYSQPLYFTGGISKYFSPLPVGRWLILSVYWTAVLILLWSNTILKPSDPMFAYKWEKVGFRAAWVTVTQIPLLYLLSTKFNLISLLTGISYERLNWLHRWAARTVLLTAIVHWSFFLREWWIAGFVQLELELMPMVKYGFGAFGTIAWMILSGFGFFRAMNYEVFVLQHVAAAGVLLWLLFCHVPAYARYNIWMSVGFVAFDWGVRIIWNISRNTHLFSKFGLRLPGYLAQLESLPGDVVRLVIDDADFKWSPGQHAYLTVPALRPTELHPFTIANAQAQPPDGSAGRLTMLIKARSGFTKSLRNAALKSHKPYRVLLSGPWGMPPDLLHYETVVLVACASGASFTMPLLEQLVHEQNCVRKIVVHWVIRSAEQYEWYSDTIRSLMAQVQDGVRLRVIVHVTASNEDIGSRSSLMASSEVDDSSSGNSISMSEGKTLASDIRVRVKDFGVSSLMMQYGQRPTVESMIRPAVEAALGETAVVCCGGAKIMAQVRTFVAALSDERAVHKGTGAQGIYLWTETYGW